MRIHVLLGACFWLGACAGHTPTPAAQDRAQCLEEQTGRLGMGPEARATAELLCSSSFSNTHLLYALCQDGGTLAPDGGCTCIERLESLGPGVGCRVSRGPDWHDLACGTQVDLCGTLTTCNCE